MVNTEISYYLKSLTRVPTLEGNSSLGMLSQSSRLMSCLPEWKSIVDCKCKMVIYCLRFFLYLSREDARGDASDDGCLKVETWKL